MVHEVVGTEVACLTSYSLALERRAGDHAMMSDALESAFASSSRARAGQHCVWPLESAPAKRISLS